MSAFWLFSATKRDFARLQPDPAREAFLSAGTYTEGGAYNPTLIKIEGNTLSALLLHDCLTLSPVEFQQRRVNPTLATKRGYLLCNIERMKVM